MSYDFKLPRQNSVEQPSFAQVNLAAYQETKLLKTEPETHSKF